MRAIVRIASALCLALGAGPTLADPCKGCCQSNENLSPVRAARADPCGLGRKGLPLGQGGRASLSIDLPADEVALLVEVIMEGGVG